MISLFVAPYNFLPGLLLSEIRISDLFLLFMILLLFFQDRKIHYPRFLYIFLIAYLGTHYISLLISIYYGGSMAVPMIYFGKLLQFAVISVVSYNYCIRNQSIKPKLVKSFLFVIFINSLYVLHRSQMVTSPTMLGTDSIFVTGYVLSFGILVSTPIATRYLLLKRYYFSLLYFFISLFMLIALVMNGSRSILVGTATGISIYMVYYFRKKGVIFNFISILGVFFLYLLGSIPTAISSIFLAIRNPMEIRSIRIRLSRWQSGVDLWIDQPLFGYGLSSIHGNNIVIENWYILTLTESGIFGFVIVVASLVYLIGVLCRHAMHNNKLGANNALLIGVLGIFIMFFIDSAFSAPVFAIRSTEIFSLLLGLAASHIEYSMNTSK